MLSENTINIIKSTVPVLETYGTEITKRFYERLFTNHPELLNVFNHVNQKQGKQQKALANAVYAAAVHIDQLENILPVVKQIAHKHRSLGIKPEQYPIVGENLLAAIKEVLGDAATVEILDAWAEAYGLIADVFISVEKEMYAQAEQQAGGWEGFRAFKVDRKVQESDVITSFYLVPEDGAAIASFQPGQYISIKAAIPGEKNTHIRQYSLSDASNKPYYRISVKREDSRDHIAAGIVSCYLHEQIQEGDTLSLSAPAGDFILDISNERPVVLLSGGVGLTPMISMLNTIAASQPSRQVTFIHAALNGKLHAMGSAVKQLAAQNSNISSYFCYEQPTESDRATKAFDKAGYIDVEWLQSVIPSTEAIFYFCGPLPFMKAINKALQTLGVPSSSIHFEFFGPAGDLEEAKESVPAAQL
ncbi:MAG TPA: NO-inducible flavohemoprotein [Candidatus Paenibacillus intestinavium]|nr:NO-inducible flavohemoprotein [Candidatus Paenibacillus intestinavium]